MGRKHLRYEKLSTPIHKWDLDQTDWYDGATGDGDYDDRENNDETEESTAKRHKSSNNTGDLPPKYKLN